jgi:hypothetical protein
VLHDINMGARFCDEIVAPRGGRLIAMGEWVRVTSDRAGAATCSVAAGHEFPLTVWRNADAVEIVVAVLFHAHQIAGRDDA